ncbi:hypothetical protein Bca52824_051583 [Brassica carinata]|uniref:Uncharacterized protein n=1 Tax=Brassica carinata TaxID=52824 RepID=A0A8X7R368_BRACI|nr:hypothetical protein Bca52824_051583 [Brassica carinata]
MFPGRGKGQASGFDDVDPMISRHLSTGLTCVFSVTDEPAFISQAHLVVNEVLVKPVSKARLILLWFVQRVGRAFSKGRSARPRDDGHERMESVTCAAVVLLENSEIEIKNKNQKLDGDGEALISKSISSNRKPTLRLLSFTGVGDLFISVGEVAASIVV